jgi:hypothetical protein
MPIFTKPIPEFRLFIQHRGRYEDLCFKNGVSGSNVYVIYPCVTKREWIILKFYFFMGWDLRHQVLRPLLAYCTAPDDR